MKTYTKQLSSVPKSVEQRARRLAKSKGLYVSKFRSPQHYAGAYQEYWCDNQLFVDLEELLNYLSEEK
jgi:hypothetical protein